MDEEIEQLCAAILDPAVPLQPAATAYALTVARQRARLREARAIKAESLRKDDRAGLAAMIASLAANVTRLDEAWTERWMMEEARSSESFVHIMRTMRAAICGGE